MYTVNLLKDPVCLFDFNDILSHRNDDKSCEETTRGTEFKAQSRFVKGQLKVYPTDAAGTTSFTKALQPFDTQMKGDTVSRRGRSVFAAKQRSF